MRSKTINEDGKSDSRRHMAFILSPVEAFSSLQEINIEQLLSVIHHYFVSLGVDEIRRRGSQDEKSLRMVKTLVHEICKLMVSLSAFQMHTQLR